MLGDGAGALVLESLEHVEERGAIDAVWAELVGFSCNNDANHLTRNELEGNMRCIQDLLKKS